jgi:L-lactate utilization protein LutC
MDQKIIENLTNNGFEVYSFETSQEVIQKVRELIPEGSEVMTMSSTTLDQLGLSTEINESGKYNSVKTKLYSGDESAKATASVPEYAIGSVHAVTEKGQLVIASATGSQLPAYAYGGKNVIFVVSTQKIVADLDSAFKRIYDYVLPLENERAMKAYGVGSSVNKLLVINKEVSPSRIKILFINQKLGF